MQHRSSITIAAFVLAFVALGCDPQPTSCDDEHTAARVVFDYDCGPTDEQVTLSAWLGERFVGAVAKGCDAGTLRVEIDEPGTWRIEAKIGAQPTVECETEIVADQIDAGSELAACE